MRQKIILLVIFVGLILGLAWILIGSEKPETSEVRNPPELPAPTAQKVTPLLADAATPVHEAIPDLPAIQPMAEMEAKEYTDDELNGLYSGTGIEGYIYYHGRGVPGARVSWRTSRDMPHLPPGWQGTSLDNRVQDGPTADFTVENPLGSPGSRSVRLGAGFERYDTAISRTFRTEPGRRYELTLDSRYVHGYHTDNNLLGIGQSRQHQIGRYGIDLTGQTRNPKAPSIDYQSVVDGPNNLWRRFRTEFTATRERTSLWLHAAQLDAHVGLVWFDSIRVRPVGGEEEIDLLHRPQEEEGIPSEFLGSVESGAGGYYRIAGIQPGDYDLLASLSGSGAAQKQSIRIPLGSMVPVNLTLLGGGAIRGSVRDIQTQVPISGARVTAYMTREERRTIPANVVVDRISGLTNRDGEFFFDGLAVQKRYQVRVEADGYMETEEVTAIPDGGPVYFRLHRKGGITGTVVERGTGRGVEGAFVRVMDNETMARVSESGPGGRFEIWGLEPEKIYGVQAEKDGRWDMGSIAMVHLASASDTQTIRLTIPSGYRVEGRVTLAGTQQPVPGLDLAFENEAASFEMTEAMPMAETAFQRYTGRAMSDELRERIRERLESAGPQIAERVAGHLALFTGARTDSNGEFMVDGIGGGRWAVHLRDERFSLVDPETFSVQETNVTWLDIRVARNPVIQGYVVDDTGLPVNGARIWCRRMRNLAGEEHPIYSVRFGLAHSGPDGRFEAIVPNLENLYDLVATTDDGMLGFYEGARVSDRLIEIRLERHQILKGRLVTDTGRPMAGLKVVASGPHYWGQQWSREGRTDGEGRFTIHQLLEGQYELRFFNHFSARNMGVFGPIQVSVENEPEEVNLVIERRNIWREE